MSFADELAKTRTHCSYEQSLVFFTTLILQLKHIEDNSVPTAYTNGKLIGYNQQFFMGLDKKRRMFLLAHETMHVALYHIEGRGHRDPQVWNMACDYFINLLLVDGGMQLIEGGLYDKQYADMSSIEIYEYLMKNPNKQPQSNPMAGDVGTGGSDSNPSTNPELAPIDPQEMQELQSNMENLLLEAALQHEMATGEKPGKGSKGLEKLLDSLRKPILPWKKQLRKYLTAQTKSGSSYKRPLRKYLAHGFYLPSRIGSGLEKIMWGNDISGSVSTDEWIQSLSEIAFVLKEFQPKEIEVCEFNDSLVSSETIRSLNDFKKLPFRKGGGTDVRELMDHYIKDTKSKALFVFTDGYLYQEHLNVPKKPVVWLIYNNPNFEPRFGKAIHFST